MDLDDKIEDLSREHGRFHAHAYEFVREALDYTVTHMENPGHITGQELLNGIRELARENFGRLARLVFDLWGVHTTRDFGEIVFHLIDAQILSKRDSDSLADFDNIYDFDEALQVEIDPD